MVDFYFVLIRHHSTPAKFLHKVFGKLSRSTFSREIFSFFTTEILVNMPVAHAVAQFVTVCHSLNTEDVAR